MLKLNIPRLSQTEIYDYINLLDKVTFLSNEIAYYESPIYHDNEIGLATLTSNRIIIQHISKCSIQIERNLVSTINLRKCTDAVGMVIRYTEATMPASHLTIAFIGQE